MKNDKIGFYGTFDKLVEQLDEFENWQEITKYEVTEHFGNKPVKNFNFLNLKAEIEDGMIFFYDAEELIYETNSVLLGFLETSIQTMYYSIPKEKVCEIRIIFPDGYVDIVAHARYEIPELEYACTNFDSPEMEQLYREYYSEEHDYSY